MASRWVLPAAQDEAKATGTLGRHDRWGPAKSGGAQRKVKKWTVLAALVLVVGAATSAAAGTMVAPDVNITVIIPKFGLVLPSNGGNWSFTLTSSDQDPNDGFTFTASEAAGTYFLRVWSNDDVTVTLSNGTISVGGNTFNPVYSWATGTGATGALTSPFNAGSSATLYVSGGPHNGAILNLSGFSVTVMDITQFTPGTASGTLEVTVAATQS